MRLLSTGDTKTNNFDIARFVLASLVVFSHSYLLLSGHMQDEPLLQITNGQINFGTFSVYFFFLISGFLILQSWYSSRGTLDYLVKRCLRILPAFIVVSLLCLLLFGPLGLGTPSLSYKGFVCYWSKANFTEFLTNIFFLQRPVVPSTFKAVPYPGAINDPIWTIRYEFVCYFIVAILGLAKLYKRKLFPLALFAVVYCFLSVHELVSEPFLPRIGNKPMEICFAHFLAGNLFFYYRNFIPRSALLAVFCLVILLISTFWFQTLILAMPIFGGYILFYFIFSTKFCFGNFAKHGDFSYGVYLYSWPIQQLVVLYFFDFLNLPFYFLLCLLLSVLAAYISFHYVEKPALKFKKQFGLSIVQAKARLNISSRFAK